MKEVLIPRDYEQTQQEPIDQTLPTFEKLNGFPEIKPRIEPWGALQRGIQESAEKLPTHTHAASEVSGLPAVVNNVTTIQEEVDNISAPDSLPAGGSTAEVLQRDASGNAVWGRVKAI